MLGISIGSKLMMKVIKAKAKKIVEKTN